MLIPNRAAGRMNRSPPHRRPQDSPSRHEVCTLRCLRRRIQMASIHKEIQIDARPETAWAALRDVGALHTRLVPGFVTDTKLEDGARIVTFGNGMVARELIVDVDDESHRVAWSVVGGQMTHHNASAQVFPNGAKGCRFVWIADLLPNEVGPTIAGMMEQGMSVIKKTLEATERSRK